MRHSLTHNTIQWCNRLIYSSSRAISFYKTVLIGSQTGRDFRDPLIKLQLWFFKSKDEIANNGVHRQWDLNVEWPIFLHWYFGHITYGGEFFYPGICLFLLRIVLTAIYTVTYIKSQDILSSHSIIRITFLVMGHGNNLSLPGRVYFLWRFWKMRPTAWSYDPGWPCCPQCLI